MRALYTWIVILTLPLAQANSKETKRIIIDPQLDNVSIKMTYHGLKRPNEADRRGYADHTMEVYLNGELLQTYEIRVGNWKPASSRATRDDKYYQDIWQESSYTSDEKHLAHLGFHYNEVLGWDQEKVARHRRMSYDESEANKIFVSRIEDLVKKAKREGIFLEILVDEVNGSLDGNREFLSFVTANELPSPQVFKLEQRRERAQAERLAEETERLAERLKSKKDLQEAAINDDRRYKGKLRSRRLKQKYPKHQEETQGPHYQRQ